LAAKVEKQEGSQYEKRGNKDKVLSRKRRGRPPKKSEAEPKAVIN
jgi:hypothetical protein